MVGIVEIGAPKTFLESVQDVCGTAGLTRPETVESPDRNAFQAIKAVQQSINRIWYRTRWDWRFTWWALDIVANQMWYELPSDFDASGSGFGIHKSPYPLTFLNWETMIEQFPMIRNLPPTFGTVGTDLEAAESGCEGLPNFWTVKAGYVGLWVPPSAAFIEQSSPSLVGGYYRKMFMPTADGDELGLPLDLMPAHDNLALGIFKQYKEQPDSKLAKNEGESLLMEAVARQRRVYWETAQLTTWERS